MTRKLTTSSGKPIYENENSMTVGPHGPIVLQDHQLTEILAHFNRERIPERVVHAKGSGAYGTFTVTNDISRYTQAKLFDKVGNECRIFVRFSIANSEKGSPDTERDMRGFCIKFYTEDGNWDLISSSLPVFPIKDLKKLPDLVHSHRRDPHTNLKSATMMWDYLSLNPETLHYLMMLFSDHGTPYSYRHMNGYGVNTYSMYNANNERVWIKFHLKTAQGIKNFSSSEADFMRGRDLDWCQRDLLTAIRSNDFPQWTLQIQVMNDNQAKSFRWNPFDPTKIWPHKEFPLIEVGLLQLNEMPENYFAEVEQAAFSPTNLIEGIGLSPDRVLQGMTFAYPDANRHRLGTNYDQIPVNRPICPVHNYQRDGSMTVNGNGGATPNYSPASFNELEVEKQAKEPPLILGSNIMGIFNRNENDNDHYTQSKWLYNTVMNDRDRQNLTQSLTDSMRYIGGSKREEIIIRQLNHIYLIDQALANKIADSLSVSLSVEQL